MIGRTVIYNNKRWVVTGIEDRAGDKWLTLACGSDTAVVNWRSIHND